MAEQDNNNEPRRELFQKWDRDASQDSVPEFTLKKKAVKEDDDDSPLDESSSQHPL